MEGLTHHRQSEKSRRLSVEETEETCTGTNSRTKCPVILGAKSGIGVELTRGRKLGETNGLDLNTSTENEGGILPCDWTRRRDDSNK